MWITTRMCSPSGSLGISQVPIAGRPAVRSLGICKQLPPTFISAAGWIRAGDERELPRQPGSGSSHPSAELKDIFPMAQQSLNWGKCNAWSWKRLGNNGICTPAIYLVILWNTKTRNHLEINWCSLILCYLSALHSVWVIRLCGVTSLVWAASNLLPHIRH